MYEYLTNIYVRSDDLNIVYHCLISFASGRGAGGSAGHTQQHAQRVNDALIAQIAGLIKIRRWFLVSYKQSSN